MVARAYRVTFTGILAWAAMDVLVAAWYEGRHRESSEFYTAQRAVSNANLTAVAFHDHTKLRESAQEVEARRPEWMKRPTSGANGTFDDFAAMAARMGAV